MKKVTEVNICLQNSCKKHNIELVDNSNIDKRYYFLFSSLSKESIEKERKRHDKAIEGQERLDYINNQIMKQCKGEKRFVDHNSAMQQYFIVTGRRLEPLPPKPVLSDFYVPSEDHHNQELAFITLSMVGIGAFLWYSDK